MKFNDQNRPYRRCLSEAERSAYQYFVHIADLSAWGAHRRAIGRYIGGAPIHCAPTGYERSWLVKLIIDSLQRTSLVRGQVAPVFRAWSLVIRRSMFGEDDRLDIAAYGEIGDHAHPARREQRNQVIQYGIGCRLVADLAVAIFIDVEL